MCNLFTSHNGKDVILLRDFEFEIVLAKISWPVICYLSRFATACLLELKRQIYFSKVRDVSCNFTKKLICIYCKFQKNRWLHGWIQFDRSMYCLRFAASNVFSVCLDWIEQSPYNIFVCTSYIGFISNEWISITQLDYYWYKHAFFA